MLRPLCFSIVLLTACGFEPSTPPGPAAVDMRPAVDGPVRVTQTVRSGTRLLIRYAVFADGAQLPIGLWDTQFNVPCSVGVGNAGPLSIICTGETIPLAGMMTGVQGIAP